MSWLLEDYSRTVIYMTDGFRNLYIPKFRLTMTVDEPNLTITWNAREQGGENRRLTVDYRDVESYGYDVASSATQLMEMIDDMIDSAWTNIQVGDLLNSKGQLLSHDGTTDAILNAGTNEYILHRNNSTLTGLEWISATAVFDASGYRRMFCQCFYGDTGANLQLTNQANAENFLAAVSRDVTVLDLTTYTQCRLVTRVQTNSASANNPRLRLRYHTAFSTTVTDYVDIGTSEVATSLTSTGLADSGWINLATGAKADVYVTVTQIGGDGAADPVIGFINAYFR